MSWKLIRGVWVAIVQSKEASQYRDADDGIFLLRVVRNDDIRRRGNGGSE